VLNLSGKLIDAERIEAGNFLLRSSDTDLGRIVNDAVQLARSASEIKGVRLDAKIPANLPAIELDVVQIERVLSNVLGNAIKFTPAGGRINVEVQQLAAALRITVRDNGIGVAPGSLASLGNKHYRAPSAVGAEGNGLGLFIVAAVVEAHGGELDIQSRLNAGTTVVMTLPLRSAAPARTAQSPSPQDARIGLPVAAETA